MTAVLLVVALLVIVLVLAVLWRFKPTTFGLTLKLGPLVHRELTSATHPGQRRDEPPAPPDPTGRPPRDRLMGSARSVALRDTLRLTLRETLRLRVPRGDVLAAQRDATGRCPPGTTLGTPRWTA